MEQAGKNIKSNLVKNLQAFGVFWSYDDIKDEVPDEDLIEKTLIYLDLEEINKLFKIFPREKIKKVWKNNILSQEPYYHNLNKFISWYYFKKE